jgi:uncharacterized membrane protein
MNFDFIYRFLTDLGYTHPLHPTITHLTIGLVMGALIFRLVALLTSYEKYGRTARHCSTLAFVAVFPTVILGLMDWTHYYGANWIFPIRMKMILAAILTGLLLLSMVFHAGRKPRSGLLLVVYLLGFAAVVGLGYFGGEIVYGKRAARETGVQGAGGKAQSSAGKTGAAGFAAVKKIFANSCTNCHSGSNPPKSLDLTTYSGLMKGSQAGPVVKPGNPGESELIRRVKGLTTPRMPLAGPALSEAEIQTLETWVQAGAPETGLKGK